MLRATTGEYRGTAAVQDLEVRSAQPKQPGGNKSLPESRRAAGGAAPRVDRQSDLAAGTHAKPVTGWARRGDVLQP